MRLPYFFYWRFMFVNTQLSTLKFPLFFAGWLFSQKWWLMIPFSDSMTLNLFLMYSNSGNIYDTQRKLSPYTSTFTDFFDTISFWFLISCQGKVHELAGDDFRFSVLDSIKRWIQVIHVEMVCFSSDGSIRTWGVLVSVICCCMLLNILKSHARVLYHTLFLCTPIKCGYMNLTHGCCYNLGDIGLHFWYVYDLLNRVLCFAGCATSVSTCPSCIPGWLCKLWKPFFWSEISFGISPIL